VNKLLLNSDYVELYVKSVTYNLRVSFTCDHICYCCLTKQMCRCVCSLSPYQISLA